MKTGKYLTILSQRSGFAAFCRRCSGFLAVLVCACFLILGVVTSATPQDRQLRENGHREIAVSFDDLPIVSVTQLDAAARREITKKLLECIRSNNIPAIGFVNEYGLYGFQTFPAGAPDEGGISLLRMWLDAGLELGNHTFAHVDLHATWPTAFKEDVIRGEIVTGKLLQQKGMRLRYFRHPYLHTGSDLKSKREAERFLMERGYRVAPVTVDNEDYLFAAAYSKAVERGDKMMQRRVGDAYLLYTERVFSYNERLSVTLFGREIKQILLVHANALNADYFGRVTQMMKGRGYSFISLEQALRDSAYSSADTYTGVESINWLARWAITRGVKSIENVYEGLPDVPDFVVKAAAPE